ncbi:dolichyl-phosphate-mannose--protein mannosyltransferase [Haloglycomyces albus]|uniref:dolichyl-phosphate-mannose--protein mannosyltransferase n=1 Tax=Haloglycomyces albus TaxID=526067 RepID=UPI00046D486D|nr:phospholipid carrier-dependent glycosyltransferase [Haloglycomyces albus]
MTTTTGLPTPPDMPPGWHPKRPPGPTPWLRRRFHHPEKNHAWTATLLVTAVAAIVRLVGLSHPSGLIFDEVYYAQDARTLLQHGVEWDLASDTAAFVAHPPFGKWLIGLGQLTFGYNETGWRIASATVGVLTVFVLIRLLLRMTGSMTLSALGGLLLALEGSHVVLSRVALLDVFLAFFVLLGFYCLVRDRQTHDHELWGKRTAFLVRHRWRIACGAAFGLAMGIKWSALWFILAALLLVVVWDACRNTAVKRRRPWWRALPSVLLPGAVSVGVYLASWWGWFANSEAYGRRQLEEQGSTYIPVVTDVANWFQYHLDIYNFHAQLSAEHSYQSTPLEWLFNLRPVVFYWSSDVSCGADKCAAEVLLLGTPLLWWLFIPALLAMALWGIARKDWRAGLVVVVVTAGILPWLFYPDRTMFFFYIAPVVPFFIIAVVWMLGLILGPAGSSSERRLIGALIVGAYVAAVVLCFAYFWPLYTGEPMNYDDWHSRIWLSDRWI